MHPRIRIPLWIAMALPVAAYVFRSTILRGGDWRPDLPWDIGLAVALVAIIGLVAWMRSVSAAEERPEDEGDSRD